MKNYVAIGVFAFGGAILRFVLEKMPWGGGVFPVDTLIINVTGSFMLALVFTAAFEVWNIREEIRLGIGTGFIGAYTTFSTLCKEVVQLMSSGYYFYAAAYLTISVGLGLFAAYLGIMAARVYIYKIISPQKRRENSR